jgi:hypothetical protein
MKDVSISIFSRFRRLFMQIKQNYSVPGLCAVSKCGMLSLSLALFKETVSEDMFFITLNSLKATSLGF